MKNKEIIKRGEIEIKKDEVLFQYSLFKKVYLSTDIKTFYKYHKLLTFIEEEKCSQEIINQFYLNTLEYLKNQKYIYKKSSILISLILKVINNDKIFTEEIIIWKKKFSNELTFIIYKGEIFNKNSSIFIQFIQK